MTKDSRITVWIIEESQSARTTLRAIFEVKDVAVHGCGRSKRLSFEHQPGVASCVLLDARMPDMTPIELILLLRKEGLHLPIFVLTGKGRDVLMERVAKSGACIVLDEPVDGDTIARLIRALPHS